MNHSACEHLDDFLDGHLEAARVTEFEQHLSSCEGCRRQIEWDQQFNSSLSAAWEEIVAPNHLRDPSTLAVEDNLASPLISKPKSLSYRKANWWLGLSVSAMILLTATLVWQLALSPRSNPAFVDQSDGLAPSDRTPQNNSETGAEDESAENDSADANSQDENATPTIARGGDTSVKFLNTNQSATSLVIPIVNDEPGFTIVRAYPTQTFDEPSWKSKPTSNPSEESYENYIN